jgi:hypothetical protein
MTVAIMVTLTITTMIWMTAPAPGSHHAQQAYEDKETESHDIVYRGQDLCCPEDPSSPNVLQNRALQAWAGQPDVLKDTFEPWLADPQTTDFAVKASWAPRGDHAIHTIDLFRSGPSDGKSAGSQALTQPARQGPAFVIPRLDAVSAESSADILTVPIHHLWPYNTGPQGSHGDHITTEITYQRSSPGDEEPHEVSLQSHTEITGNARPAIDMQFQEPDWQNIDIENEDLGVALSSGSLNRSFTQVLAKDDLVAERTLNDALQDTEDLANGEYPQHPFHLQVNLTGPPALQTGTTNTDPTRNLTTAYQLTIDTPRNWTDVEVTGNDQYLNQDNNWTHTEIETLPSGGHRITGRLNDTATFNLTDPKGPSDPDWLLTNTSHIQAPFRFHARPPTDTEATQLGFQDLQATLQSIRYASRATTDLTVEIATSPGRVHRTLDPHTPQSIPPTPWANRTHDTPQSILLPLGATLANGGEATHVTQIQWTIPQATDPPRRLEPLEDFATDANWTTETDNQTLTVTWTPNGSTTPQGTDVATCDQLAACAVAANLVLDGRGLNQHPQWAPPTLTTLYDDHDTRSYVDWFIRSSDAWDGVPRDEDRLPGFALAHRGTIAEGGPTEGSYRFTLPPTLTPTCDEDEYAERNQAHRRYGPNRIHYDFGPREDGLPHLASDCPGQQRTFTAIGKNGGRYHTDAAGQHPYRSIGSLSGQTVAGWQNGLAESQVQGPEQTSTGSTANFTVTMDSILDRLVVDDVGNATLEAKIYDPHNAWENEPWRYYLLRETTGLGTYNTNTNPTDRTNHHAADANIPLPPTNPCNPTIRVQKAACRSADAGEPIPSTMNLSVDIPKDMVPGTHLLILEITWNFTPVQGPEITQTGRLIEPFDVTIQGHRAHPSALGVTTWHRDWR